MATPESLSKQAVQAVFDAARAIRPDAVWGFMPQPGFGQADLPDFLYLIRGIVFAVETKADPSEGGKHPRPGQLRMLESIRKAVDLGFGGFVGVVGDAASFENLKARVIDLFGRGTPDEVTIAAIPWRSTKASTRRKIAPRIPLK